jgi:urea transport system permease protein
MFTAVVIAFAVLPAVTGQHLTGLVGRFLVFALVAVSLDLLWGYAGQLSLGHAAFFGLGAYAAGLVLVGGGGVARSAAALALAVAVPGGIALLMGYLLFRGGVGGVYFAIVTLLVSLLLEQLAITWSGFTGGINGLFGMAPVDLGVVTISSLSSAYYLILVVVAPRSSPPAGSPAPRSAAR